MLPVGAETIISLALVAILEHLVGFVDLFEFFFRARLLVDIRMILTRKLAVSLLDVTVSASARNAQNLVVILVFHDISELIRILDN